MYYIISEVFDALSTQLQCHLLMCIADKATDIIEQTVLNLIMLQRYPAKVAENGVGFCFEILVFILFNSVLGTKTRFMQVIALRQE